MVAVTAETIGTGHGPVAAVLTITGDHGALSAPELADMLAVVPALAGPDEDDRTGDRPWPP